MMKDSCSDQLCKVSLLYYFLIATYRSPGQPHARRGQTVWQEQSSPNGPGLVVCIPFWTTQGVDTSNFISDSGTYGLLLESWILWCLCMKQFPHGVSYYLLPTFYDEFFTIF